MQVAQGREFFRLCQGLVVIGGKEYVVPVHVGDELIENLLGSQWLETMQLVVNKPQGILTLEMVGSEF